MTNKLIKRLKQFLSVEFESSSSELKTIKSKLSKLKKQCKKLDAEIKGCVSKSQRKALQDQLAVAMAVRKKALKKYRQMMKK